MLKKAKTDISENFLMCGKKKPILKESKIVNKKNMTKAILDFLDVYNLTYHAS